MHTDKSDTNRISGGGAIEYGAALRVHWPLENGCTFLNHGSFGATPHRVLQVQQRYRERMERQPVRFMTTEMEQGLRASADTLARFLGTSGEQIALVDNATAAVNAVLRSIRWRAGDRILITDHTYGGVRKAVQYICDRYDVELIEARVPFPIQSSQQVVDAIRAAWTGGIRLAVVDHVTSPTAFVLPIHDIIEWCHECGTEILIDGAHAPGMIALNLDAIGADYYAGNCHKWLFSPRSCGFLWARPGRCDGLHPPVISWGYGEGFTAEFDWPGTRDATAWLTVPEGIAFHRELGGPALRQRNHALVVEAMRLLADAWQVQPVAPEDMLGSMAVLTYPGDRMASKEEARRIHDVLLDSQRIEVPVLEFAGRLRVRISAQAYNHIGEYEALARAVRRLVHG